ncbi:MAG: ribokinase [Fibrobacteria bacterium]|nr:ribokinase [Fibrobacteria bacterium]
MSKKITVVGSSNTDMIIKMDRIPRPGETLLGGDFSMADGGKGANQAVAAARAGGDVTFVARTGKDMFGENAVKGFLKDKINCEFITSDESAPSGVALIFVGEDGENSIAVAGGANNNLSPADVEKAKAVITASDVLVMQLETPMETIEAASKMVAGTDCKVILNPAPAAALSDEILKNVTILTPNETEAEVLSGVKVENEADAEKAAKVLMGKGVKTVIVTMGKKGALIADGDSVEVVPAFEVKAVDTTAAGDTFNGALAVALAEGKNLKDAVTFANGAGALSVTKLGAQPSAPTREDIDSFLA